jgi:bifunctional UDP-N-acetylglucosamine pyrophosphorylase/glucosamine-1-phosphate N-acetyltransferase
MQAVILAAGRGTRLHPITKTRTKAMCPVDGKPIVERVMDTMVANGIADFILVISPDDTEITAHFEHKSAIQADIQFVHQKEQLGMGHALLQAAAHIQDDFILSSCDNLVEEHVILHMLTMWVGDPPPNGILTLLRVGPEELTRMGVIEMDKEGRITRIVEKPSLDQAPSDIASPPLYLFSPRLLQYLSKIKTSKRGEIELQDAIQNMIENDGNVYGLMLPDRLDLTHPSDLLKLNLHFLSDDPLKEKIQTDRIGKGTRILKPVVIESNVIIGSDCIIGPNVFIESGVNIGNDVRLDNCVILRGSHVSTASQISKQIFW